MITYKTDSWKTISEITVRNVSGQIVIQELKTKDGSTFSTQNEIVEQLSMEDTIDSIINIRLIDLDDFLSPEVNIEYYESCFSWKEHYDDTHDYISKLFNSGCASLTEAGADHITSPLDEYFKIKTKEESDNKSRSLLDELVLEPKTKVDYRHYILRILIEMAISDGHLDSMEKEMLTQSFETVKIDLSELDEIRKIPLDEAINYFKTSPIQLKSTLTSLLKNMALVDDNIADKELEFLAYVTKEINIK